jgi:hypothetical protein
VFRCVRAKWCEVRVEDDARNSFAAARHSGPTATQAATTQRQRSERLAAQAEPGGGGAAANPSACASGVFPFSALTLSLIPRPGATTHHRAATVLHVPFKAHALSPGAMACHSAALPPAVGVCFSPLESDFTAAATHTCMGCGCHLTLLPSSFSPSLSLCHVPSPHRLTTSSDTSPQPSRLTPAFAVHRPTPSPSTHRLHSHSHSARHSAHPPLCTLFVTACRFALCAQRSAGRRWWGWGWGWGWSCSRWWWWWWW